MGKNFVVCCEDSGSCANFCSEALSRFGWHGGYLSEQSIWLCRGEMVLTISPPRMPPAQSEAARSQGA
ncbi:hypothetical protein ACVWWD_000010 [Mesorhizobium sp. URHB0026]